MTKLTQAQLDANIVHAEIVKHVSHSGQILRWAVLTTKNGFAVTGQPSACIDPVDDNPTIGEDIALKHATNTLWLLMGYEAKTQRMLDVTVHSSAAKSQLASTLKDAL